MSPIHLSTLTLFFTLFGHAHPGLTVKGGRILEDVTVADDPTQTEVYRLTEKILLDKLSLPEDTDEVKLFKHKYAQFLIEIALEEQALNSEHEAEAQKKTSRRQAESSVQDSEPGVAADAYQTQNQYPVDAQQPQNSAYPDRQGGDNAAITYPEQYPQDNTPQVAEGQGVGQQQQHPLQPAPYPVQPAPYPVQPSAYPVQPAPYPLQPSAYPAKPAAYPPGSYPTIAPQNLPYPYPYPGALPTRAPETLEEIDKLVQQIFRLNITGILDQSFTLVGSNPIRNISGGVLKLVFCDPVSRLIGQCKGNDTANTRSLKWHPPKSL